MRRDGLRSWRIPFKQHVKQHVNQHVNQHVKQHVKQLHISKNNPGKRPPF
ncbi:MAG: hypothetical protein JWL81_1933 [Verrucomicrobiales bacterium]|nr:hypothetical protein [Verrucomicrobiales bacterium]